MPFLLLVYFCLHAIFLARSARPDVTHHHLVEPTKLIFTAPSGQLSFGGAGFIETSSAHGAVGGTGARPELEAQLAQLRTQNGDGSKDAQISGLEQQIAALPQDSVQVDDPNAIARPDGALAKLADEYTAMKDKWQAAASKVFVGGDPAGANFIAKTGKDWMLAAQKFKVTVGHMRAHAQRVYNNIVKSHVKAAKKQYHTFAQEIIKLKKVREEHRKIAAAAREAAQGGDVEEGEGERGPVQQSAQKRQEHGPSSVGGGVDRDACEQSCDQDKAKCCEMMPDECEAQEEGFCS